MAYYDEEKVLYSPKALHNFQICITACDQRGKFFISNKALLMIKHDISKAFEYLQSWHNNIVTEQVKICKKVGIEFPVRLKRDRDKRKSDN